MLFSNPTSRTNLFSPYMRITSPMDSSLWTLTHITMRIQLPLLSESHPQVMQVNDGQMIQNGCWLCGSTAHLKRSCPHRMATTSERRTATVLWTSSPTKPSLWVLPGNTQARNHAHCQQCVWTITLGGANNELPDWT